MDIAVGSTVLELNFKTTVTITVPIARISTYPIQQYGKTAGMLQRHVQVAVVCARIHTAQIKGDGDLTNRANG